MQSVLIAGAGPTGLVMALSLARRGVPVRIIDRKDGPTRESRAMGLHARTLEFYRHFGFADEVVERGVVGSTIHLRSGARDVARLSLADMGDRVADAESAFDLLAERDALRHCLGRLDRQKRRAILLCYVTGLNHGEVAASLNAPLGTVKAWIRRGVVALQECLA